MAMNSLQTMAGAKELVSGNLMKLNAPLQVAPRSTVVLWFKN
jgi:hypothetical protein